MSGRCAELCSAMLVEILLVNPSLVSYFISDAVILISLSSDLVALAEIVV